MAAQEDCILYTVCKLDTLCDIMRRFNVSITDLKEYNKGKDLFSLKEGQTLLIKNTERESEKTYTLEKDEDVFTVAKKFNVSTVRILKANPNYMPQEIKQGIRIALPEC